MHGSTHCNSLHALIATQMTLHDDGGREAAHQSRSLEPFFEKQNKLLRNRSETGSQWENIITSPKKQNEKKRSFLGKDKWKKMETSISSGLALAITT